MVHYLSEVMALIKEQANNNNKYNSHITRIFMENVCDLVLLFIVFFIFIYLFFFPKGPVTNVMHLFLSLYFLLRPGRKCVYNRQKKK